MFDIGSHCLVERAHRFTDIGIDVQTQDTGHAHCHVGRHAPLPVELAPDRDEVTIGSAGITAAAAGESVRPARQAQIAFTREVNVIGFGFEGRFTTLGWADLFVEIARVDWAAAKNDSPFTE